MTTLERLKQRKQELECSIGGLLVSLQSDNIIQSSMTDLEAELAEINKLIQDLS